MQKAALEYGTVVLIECFNSILGVLELNEGKAFTFTVTLFQRNMYLAWSAINHIYDL